MGAGVPRDVPHGVAPGDAPAEGLRDLHRAIHEVRLGVGEGQVDAVARERVQGQKGLDTGDTAAGDQDAKR